MRFQCDLVSKKKILKDEGLDCYEASKAFLSRHNMIANGSYIEVKG